MFVLLFFKRPTKNWRFLRKNTSKIGFQGSYHLQKVQHELIPTMTVKLISSDTEGFDGMILHACNFVTETDLTKIKTTKRSLRIGKKINLPRLI